MLNTVYCSTYLIYSRSISLSTNLRADVEEANVDLDYLVLSSVYDGASLSECLILLTSLISIFHSIFMLVQHGINSHSEPDFYRKLVNQIKT